MLVFEQDETWNSALILISRFSLCFDFCPVLHSKADVVLAVDRCVFDHAVEKLRIVFGDGLVVAFQNLDVVFDGLEAGGLVVDSGSDFIEALFCLVVTGSEILIFFVVSCLVLSDVGVLVNAILNESGDHIQLIGEFISFFFQPTCVKCGLQNKKYTPACFISSLLHADTSIRGILMALPFQFDNSAVIKLSAVPLTRKRRK